MKVTDTIKSFSEIDKYDRNWRCARVLRIHLLFLLDSARDKMNRVGTRSVGPESELMIVNESRGLSYTIDQGREFLVD